MLIPSDQIPQADRLDEVIRTVIAISQGHRTFQDIARFIGKVDRQGRYYRKAAEIIGLVVTRTPNNSTLTPLGQEFIRTGATMNNPIFIQAVLNVPLFQRLIPFLEATINNGVSRQDIINFIFEVSELDEIGMAHRRLSSLVSWLQDLGIIVERNGRFYLQVRTINQNINLLEFKNISEPILPKATNLAEYEIVSERTNNAQDIVRSYINLAAIERADNAHRTLVNLVASRIKSANEIPRFNKLIDLATKYNGEDFIFEMKSLHIENAKTQIRNGLSQLYEYQYIQDLPDSNLVLVLENNIPASHTWMIDYLENNRNIYLLWDGDGNLYGTENTRRKFDFLDVQAPLK